MWKKTTTIFKIFCGAFTAISVVIAALSYWGRSEVLVSNIETSIVQWAFNHAAYPGIFIIASISSIIFLTLFTACFVFPELFSQIYSFLKKKNQIIKVENVILGTFANTDNPDIYRVAIKVRFLSKLKNVSILYEAYAGNIPLKSFKVLDNKNFIEGEEVEFDIAKIPKEKHINGEWIGSANNDKICEGAGYIVVLKVTASKWFFRNQNFRIFLKTAQNNVGVSGRFFLTSEMEDLFNVTR